MIELSNEPATQRPRVASMPSRRVGPPPAGEQPALLIDHATKRFVVGRKKKSVFAVNDVSMSIRRGEIYGVLGANGSGKSTLIRLISTLLTIDSGRIEVFGHDVARDDMAVKRLINRVSVDANAGDLQLLLDDTTVDDLSIDANAGSITIDAGPGAGFDGRVELNAGSLDVCVADDQVVEITLEDDNITFSHNLDDGDQARSGDTWRRGAGEPDIALRVDGNAASFTLDPDGGCR